MTPPAAHHARVAMVAACLSACDTPAPFAPPVDVATDAGDRADSLPDPIDAARPSSGECATSTGDFACADDGICCDPTTGLAWQRDKSPVQASWHEAMRYCDELGLAGGGWRLPSITELMSLTRGCSKRSTCPVCDAGGTTCLDRDCETHPGCTQCDEPATVLNGEPTDCFWPEPLGSCAQPGSTGADPRLDPLTWSSSRLEGSIDPAAFYIHFSQRAFVHANLLTAPGLARCVRGPAPTTCLTGAP